MYLCGSFGNEDVKALSAYDIDIQNFKEKQYVYEFESDNHFFEALQQELVENGHFKTVLTIDKSATMLLLNFSIVGVAGLVCDRSLDVFEESFDIQQKYILKFGDHEEELAEDIEMIKFETTRINVARYIFDFIALGLPMKRLHPRFRIDNDDDDETFYFSTEDIKEAQQDAADPRWAALSKINK